MKNVHHRLIEGIPVLEVVLDELRYEKLPLVIFYHGWQTSKELVLTQARKIAARGIRVLLPDAMHHGERRSGPISKIPSLTFWNSISFNLVEFDLFLHFYQKRDLILANQIGVGGLSMGGITTAALLTQHPEIQVASSLMGSLEPTTYAARIRHFAGERGIFIPETFLQMTAWLETVDLSLAPEKVAGRPFFIWHGTEDPKIPYAHSQQFVQKNQGAAYMKQVEFYTGQGEAHLITTDLMEQLADFYQRSFAALPPKKNT